MALNGFGPLASVVRFKPSKETFSYVIALDAPSPADLKSFDTSSDLANIKSKEKNSKHFRNVLLLPPHIASAFLSIESRNPGDIACVARAAADDFRNEFGGHSDFNEDKHEETIACILSFLWCCSKSLIKAPAVGMKTDESLSIWCDKVNSEALLPLSIPSSTSLKSTSDVSHQIDSLTGNLYGLTKLLEKQMETKESSKKKKFDSFPSFIVNMIRNASASSSMTPAESPTDALKSFIDCSALAQS